MKRVSVLGSGAWGTTLAQVLIDAGHDVLIWGRNSDVVEEINSKKTNHSFLGSAILPDSIRATTNVDEAFAFGEAVVLAIPAQSLRENLRNWKSKFPLDKPVISTLKGIESSTCHRMTEILGEELSLENDHVGLITGPNLAGELILRQPAGAVGASSNPALAALIVELFTTTYFRVYPSQDLVGCELAGASKSVIALAVGMAVGLDLGENTQSMIITRGLTEVARFGSAYGAEPLTNLGLAGMGDLVASCGSPLSRNRTFGEAIGRAGTIAEAARNAKTVEGVASAPAILELAHRVGVGVPIIEAVADVVSGKLNAIQAIDRLMSVALEEEL